MTLAGRTIKLRLMEKDDLALKVQWINDPQVHVHLHYEIPLGLAKTEKWFEKAITDNSRRDLIIETLDNKPIGIAGLINISQLHKSAEIYIAIGEKEYWGKGVMLEAESIVIKWAFNNIGMHKIWALTRSENVASIITMKKMGFQIEGTLREEKYIDGERVNIIRLGLLKDDFKDYSSPKED